MARLTALENNSPVADPSTDASKLAPDWSALALTALLVGLLSAYLVALFGSATAVALFGLRLAIDPAPWHGVAMALGTSSTALLAVVLVRALTAETDYDPTEFVELSAEDEPEFFGFVDDICRRADVPVPDKIFASPHVNAGIFVEFSPLNLFRPAERHLFVGLGMVEVLNRTELEAVLAHELGHFAQRSLWLHDGVRIVHGIVDQLDDARHAVDTLRARWSDSTIPAVGMSTLVDGGLRVAEWTWQPIAKTIERLEASVSRRLEFDADDVAVGLTGSDAIVHALVRIDWAERCHAQTLYDLERAADDDIRTDDLFFHQSRLSETMRCRLDDATLGRPPALPDDPTKYQTAFSDDEGETHDEKPGECHPSPRLREQLARRPYRRTDFDERSAWTLFSHPRALRRRVTDRLYRNRWSTDSAPRPAGEVQRHLAGEHAEILLTKDERAVYGHRFVEPGDLGEATASAIHEDWSDERLRESIRRLTGREFEEAKHRVVRHLDDTSPSPETPTPATDHSPPPNTDDNAETDRAWLADWDHRVLVAALRVATRHGEAAYDELIDRYAFHLHLQDMIRWMRHHEQLVDYFASLDGDALGTDEAPSVSQLHSAMEMLYDGLSDGLSQSPPTPSLHGLSRETPLTMLVLDSPLPERQRLTDGKFDPAATARFAGRWDQLVSRLDHLRWKSLGSLLLYQRNLFSDWT